MIGPLLIIDIKTDATRAAGSNLVDPHWGDPYPGIKEEMAKQSGTAP